ncbi:MAG: hypothetical protein LBM08_08635 [Dysgonamonadaceae bacterium]|nr:hypothetical protein [Dysgonamonadaceae bacterium]
MKKYGCILASLFLMLSACNENELDKTIFIPDSDDSNLPAYTEWGYNSFGAQYERLYFVATNAVVPCKITYRNGFLNFHLIGNAVGSPGMGYYSAEDMMLTFTFPSSPMNDYKDLVALDNTVIDLTSEACILKMEKDGKGTTIVPLEGRLFFKRAQLLRIDGEENRVILSGYFDVKFLNSNNWPEAISNGRFDVGINKDFYQSPPVL